MKRMHQRRRRVPAVQAHLIRIVMGQARPNLLQAPAVQVDLDPPPSQVLPCVAEPSILITWVRRRRLTHWWMSCLNRKRSPKPPRRSLLSQLSSPFPPRLRPKRLRYRYTPPRYRMPQLLPRKRKRSAPSSRTPHPNSLSKLHRSLRWPGARVSRNLRLRHPSRSINLLCHHRYRPPLNQFATQLLQR